MRRRADSMSRFVKRQWQRRWRSLRPVLSTLLGAAVVGFCVWVVYFSTWLAVESVAVAGETTVPDDVIVEVADVAAGTPLVGVDIDGVHDAVARIPAVATVSVHRSWPNTITVTVTERQPVAALYRSGDWWLFDSEGVRYRKTEQRDPSLAIVEYAGDPDRTALAEVASVVTALPDDIRADMLRVEASSMDSIELVLRDGRTVRWGSAAESDRKVAVLAALLSTRATVYDVSVPEQPTASRRAAP